ncbi:MAG: hypothetical protein P4N59_10070 [Negativicutes bacterium]|nr:hypothetical protein [Negativicutes bacterium]
MELRPAQPLGAALVAVPGVCSSLLRRVTVGYGDRCVGYGDRCENP